MDYTNDILNLEDRLIEAMKNSNAAELDVLIDDDLLFTGHDGRRYTKQDDLEAHRSGNIEIYSIETSEQEIKIEGDVAIVSVLKNISGSFFGETQVGIFRFTRVWKLKEGGWKIIAAHSTQVVH